MNTTIDSGYYREKAVSFLKECNCDLKYAKQFREFRTYINQIRMATGLSTTQIHHDVLTDTYK